MTSQVVASFRAIIYAVGGSPPTITVKRISGAIALDEAHVVLSSSVETARLAGAHLYQQADIRAQLTRNAETKEVVAGVVQRLRPVRDADVEETIRLWKEWAAAQEFDFSGIPDE